MSNPLVHDELVLLQVLPALDPQHAHGHDWQYQAPHLYRCPRCRIQAHDPDAVLMTCDEMQADRAGNHLRNYHTHYGGMSLATQDRILANLQRYRSSHKRTKRTHAAP